MPFPTPTPLTYTTIDFKDGANALIASYKLGDQINKPKMKNVQPLRPHGSNIQGWQGDDTFEIGEFEAEIILEVEPPTTRVEAESQLEEDLFAASSLWVGSYYSEIAKARGLGTSVPIGTVGNYAFRVKIIWLPVYHYWTDGINQLTRMT